MLQITENKIPLRLNEVANVLLKIKDEYIRDAAQAALRMSELVPHKCNNKDNVYYNKFIGGGICLAKKYKRLGVSKDLVCQDCQSSNIVKTLNYIFDRYFSGRYHASWKTVKRVVSAKPERKTKAERIKDEGDVSAEERNQQILSDLGNNSDGKIKGRASSKKETKKGRGKAKKIKPSKENMKNLTSKKKTKGFTAVNSNTVGNKKVGGN